MVTIDITHAKTGEKTIYIFDDGGYAISAILTYQDPLHSHPIC